MSTSAARVREFRQRQKAGRAVFAVEANEADLADALINVGLLDARQCDNRTAISAALSKAVDLFTRDQWEFNRN